MLSYLRMAPWLAILILIGVVSVQGSRIHRWHEQTIKLSAKLNEITSAKDAQKVETKERIKVVTERVRHADDVAKGIEQAPLPGNCKTPKEITDADI